MADEVVHLDCHRCYKKVKKILCGIPQIQDQADTKQNTVTIKVVCCNPEKIKRKTLCEGGDSIESIDQIKVPKPGDDKKPGDKKKPKGKKSTPTSPPPPPPEDNQNIPPRPPQSAPPLPPNYPYVPVFYPACFGEYCYEGRRPGGPCLYGHSGPCCRECYEGRPGGPCYKGNNVHHRGGPPLLYYRNGGYWERPVYDSYGGGGGGGVIGRDYYEAIGSGESSESCLIM